MDPTIKLSFRYLEDDYVLAMRAHYRSRLRLRLDLLCVAVLAVLGITVLPSLWGVFSIAVSILFALFLAAAFFVIPRLAFRREPKFRDEYNVVFSAEGIHFRTLSIDSRIQWSMYSRALITAHSYVLYYGVHQFSVIPRRVFRSVEEQEAFEKLLLAHGPQMTKEWA